MKSTLSVLALLMAVALALVSCGGQWVADVDGDKITLDELNTLYYAQHKHLLNLSKEDIDKYANDPEILKRVPTLDKKIFLEELIKQRLIYQQAMKDGIDSNKEVKAVIQIAKEGAVVQSYVKEKFKDEVKISDKEVEDIYRQEKDKRFRGVPVDQAEKQIRQYVASMKMQQKLVELVNNLRDAKKVEKNLKILDELQKKPAAAENKPADVKK